MLGAVRNSTIRLIRRWHGRMILVNWLRRASEEPHASTAPGPLVKALFLLWSVSISSLCAIPGGLLRRTGMVVEFEAHGLEARFWIVSGLPTSWKPSDEKRVSQYQSGETSETSYKPTSGSRR